MQWYQGLTEPRPYVEMNLTDQEEWIGYDKLEVLPEFYYLSDMLSAGKAASWVWSHAACEHGALPLLTNHHLPLLTQGWVYSTSVRSEM